MEAAGRPGTRTFLSCIGSKDPATSRREQTGLDGPLLATLEALWERESRPYTKYVLISADRECVGYTQGFHGRSDGVAQEIRRRHQERGWPAPDVRQFKKSGLDPMDHCACIEAVLHTVRALALSQNDFCDICLSTGTPAFSSAMTALAASQEVGASLWQLLGAEDEIQAKPEVKRVDVTWFRQTECVAHLHRALERLCFRWAADEALALLRQAGSNSPRGRAAAATAAWCHALELVDQADWVRALRGLKVAESGFHGICLDSPEGSKLISLLQGQIQIVENALVDGPEEAFAFRAVLNLATLERRCETELWADIAPWTLAVVENALRAWKGMDEAPATILGRLSVAKVSDEIVEFCTEVLGGRSPLVPADPDTVGDVLQMAAKTVRTLATAARWEGELPFAGSQIRHMGRLIEEIVRAPVPAVAAMLV